MQALTGKRAELLRRLATKEAARRQELAVTNQSREDTPEDYAGPSSVTIEQLAAEEQELIQVLQEERSRNDVEWQSIRNKLDKLDSVPQVEGGDSTTSLSAKELELAMLEHEIEKLSTDLPRLDPPQTDFITSLLTRNLLSSSIEQCQAGVTMKRKELDKEKRLLQEDEQTLQSLRDVRRGLELKEVRMMERKKRESNQQSAVQKLQLDVETVEESMGDLMNSLIEFCNNLFDEQNMNKRLQLRHLVDVLINKAWDYPDNPWVSINPQQYLPSIVTLLVRANIALEHPRDARTLRLVDFSR